MSKRSSARVTPQSSGSRSPRREGGKVEKTKEANEPGQDTSGIRRSLARRKISRLSECSVQRWVNQIRKHLSGQALSEGNRSTRDRRHRYTFVLMTVRGIQRFTGPRVFAGVAAIVHEPSSAVFFLKAARETTITRRCISGAPVLCAFQFIFSALPKGDKSSLPTSSNKLLETFPGDKLHLTPPNASRISYNNLFVSTFFYYFYLRHLIPVLSLSRLQRLFYFRANAIFVSVQLIYSITILKNHLWVRLLLLPIIILSHFVRDQFAVQYKFRSIKGAVIILVTHSTYSVCILDPFTACLDFHRPSR